MRFKKINKRLKKSAPVDLIKSLNQKAPENKWDNKPKEEKEMHPKDAK